MSPGPATGELRAVLEAPRGSRFSRPGVSARLMATPPSDSEPSVPGLSEAQFKAREQRLLAQMADNPRVAHRQAHGVLPHWIYEHVARIEEGERRTRPASDHPEHPEGPWKPTPAPAPHHRTRPQVPRPRPAPDDGPPPPRPPRPPLPRRPRRPRSHRKPRHRRPHNGWHLCGYTLATLAGALVHHWVSVLS